MRRILWLLIVTAAAVAIAWWVAHLQGQFDLVIGRFEIHTALPVAILGAVVAFVILYVILRVLGGLLRVPRLMRLGGARRRREKGETAVTRTLLALAAGEGTEARREASRARRLIGETPTTLLISAQAGRIAGRDGEAETFYRALSMREDASFLGFRGLLRQATAREDWLEAAAVARQAELARPGALWLRTERAQLALRTGDWKEALALSPPDGPVASLAAAAADVEPDPREARRIAKRAFNADPGLSAAAIAYARRLREAGKMGRAAEVLRRAWAAAPNPDLAKAALDGITDKPARFSTGIELTRGAPGHAESHMLLATLAMEMGDVVAARRHAEEARAAGLNQRRLWMLFADVAEMEGTDTPVGRAEQRNALRLAAGADPDSGWRCEACGTAQNEWAPICPHCHTPGKIIWTGQQRALAVLPEA